MGSIVRAGTRLTRKHYWTGRESHTTPHPGLFLCSTSRIRARRTSLTTRWDITHRWSPSRTQSTTIRTSWGWCSSRSKLSRKQLSEDCVALYSTVHYIHSTVLYYTVHSCTAEYSTLLHCTVQYCTVQYSTVLLSYPDYISKILQPLTRAAYV